MKLFSSLFISLVISYSVLIADDFSDFKKALVDLNYDKAFDIYAKNINGNETIEYKNYIYKHAVRNIQNDTETATALIDNFLAIEFNDNFGRFILSQIQLIKEEYTNALETLYTLQNSYLELELSTKVESTLQTSQDIYLNSFEDITLLKEALVPFEMYGDTDFIKKWHLKMLHFLDQGFVKEEYINILQNYETLKSYPIDTRIENQINSFYKKTLNKYLYQIEELKLLDELELVKSFVLQNGYENFTQKIEAIENKLLRNQISVGVYEKQIGLEKSGNKLFIQGNISGTPVKLLLDTGASITMLNPNSISQNLFTILDNNQILQTASGTTNAKRVMVDSFKIDDIEFSNYEIVISNRKVFNGFDGLLGMDFLGQFQFSIDKEKSILYLN